MFKLVAVGSWYIYGKGAKSTEKQVATAMVATARIAAAAVSLFASMYPIYPIYPSMDA